MTTTKLTAMSALTAMSTMSNLSIETLYPEKTRGLIYGRALGGGNQMD